MPFKKSMLFWLLIGIGPKASSVLPACLALELLHGGGSRGDRVRIADRSGHAVGVVDRAADDRLIGGDDRRAQAR